MFDASSSEEDSKNIYDAHTWPYPYLQKQPTVNKSGWCLCPAFNKITGQVYLEVSYKIMLFYSTKYNFILPSQRDPTPPTGKTGMLINFYM